MISKKKMLFTSLEEDRSSGEEEEEVKVEVEVEEIRIIRIHHEMRYQKAKPKIRILTMIASNQEASQLSELSSSEEGEEEEEAEVEEEVDEASEKMN